jgi:hypothetical protein
VAVLAVEGGVEVVSAGDDEGVDHVDHVGLDVFAGCEGQEEGQSASADDGGGVVGGEFEDATGFVGFSDFEGDSDARAVGASGRGHNHGGSEQEKGGIY